MAASGPSDDDGMVSGINVTPYIDITLVLLIVFMVTAKLIVSQSFRWIFPRPQTAKRSRWTFGVELHANGDTVVNGSKVASDNAVFAIGQGPTRENLELRAVIRADTTVQHGRVIRVLDLLKQGGVSKIAFGVTPVPAEPGAVPTPTKAAQAAGPTPAK